MILQKIIAFIIVGEILFTAMGFCGHSHDHGKDLKVHYDFHVHFFESASQDCCQDHSADHNHHTKEKTRCSCQGGFIAELTPTMYSIILKFDTFTSWEKSTYQRLWIHPVDHPPKSFC